MNYERFKPLVNRLLLELLECWQRKTSEILIAGAAYMITMKHWKEVKSECWQNPFASQNDEIEFFKHVKHEFTGRLAYYSILYEALTAVPTEYPESKSFWEAELRRYDRFVERNANFIDYLRKKHTDQDTKYFLRQNLRVPLPAHLSIYDGDPEFCTAGDYVVTGLFAETHYRSYVSAKLDR